MNSKAILIILVFLISSLYQVNPTISVVDTTDTTDDTVTITFRATVTVDTSYLELQEIVFTDGFTVDQFEMTSTDTDVFEYSVELKPGTIFKYRYAIGWPEWETLDKENKDANAYYRVLIVPDQDQTIEEEVVGFTTIEPAPETEYVNVTGQIYDASTGRGLESGEIWVGGVSANIGRNGSFYAENVVGGTQRITILPTEHQNKVIDINLEQPVSVNEMVLDPIPVEPAEEITVTFVVQVPDFPDTNKLRLMGDIPNLGFQRHFGYNSRAPIMEHIKDNWYTTTVKLHVGTAITYLYTYGGASVNNELTSNDMRNYRKAVFYEDTVIKDHVATWQNDQYKEISISVDVPQTTPAHETVYLSFGLSLIPMYQETEFTWTTNLAVAPFVSTIDYYYQLGTFRGVYNELQYDFNNQRSVNASNSQIDDEVIAWRWINNATESVTDTVNITLGVNIPYYTPDNDTLYLVGDGTSWSDPQSHPLTRVEDHYYETNLLLLRDQEYEFTLTRGDWTSKATGNFSISARYSGQLIHDYITGWIDLDHPWNRTSSLSGVMLMDWWDPKMKSLVAPAFERFSANGGEWVQYAPQWSVDHKYPTPYIGAEGGTSEEDLKYIVQQAHKYDLKVYLHVGINGEVADDFTGVGFDAYDDDEWHVFRQAFLDIVDYSSKLSQSLGIEMLALPNYVGQNMTAYDALMNESIDLTRSQYSGMLSSSIGWTNTDLTFPSRLDHVGMYLWDDYLVGDDNPSVEDLVVAIGDNLDARYRQFSEKFNKTVLFAQFAHAAVPGSNYERDLDLGFNTIQDESYSQDIQARVYEAFMQAISNRTWIEGSFSFGYFYFPLDYPDYSIAYKQAEAVQLKWSQMFGEKITISNSQKSVIQDNFIVDYSSPYTEVRYALGDNATWSGWTSVTSGLNIENLVDTSDNGGGEYMIWFQGKNGSQLSDPSTISVTVDNSAPFAEVLEMDEGYWFKFEDDTSLDLEVSIQETVELTRNLVGNTVFLPIELFNVGSTLVTVTSTDMLGRQNQQTITVEIQTPSTSTSDTSSTDSSSDTSSDTTTVTTTNLSETTPNRQDQSDGGFLSWYQFLSIFTVLPLITYLRRRVTHYR